jgi:chromosome segregation ATPase
MTKDITPWFNEIQALQQKIIELQTELNATENTASKWRQLYNTEAQQRRNETQQSQETIDNLKIKVQNLQKGFSYVKDDGDQRITTIEKQIENLQTLDELKAKIIEVSQERDRCAEKVQELTEALQQEQTSHANTRISLTNALADTVDLLAKAKAAKQQKSETTSNLQLKTQA